MIQGVQPRPSLLLRIQPRPILFLCLTFQLIPLQCHPLTLGNSIVVNGNSAHSYGSSIFTTRILPNTLPPKSICQPYKKRKEDDNNDVTVVTSANETWLQAGSHKLT